MGLIADSVPRLCCPLPFGKGQWEEAEREGEGVVLGMSLEWGREDWLPGAPVSLGVLLEMECSAGLPACCALPKGWGQRD